MAIRREASVENQHSVERYRQFAVECYQKIKTDLRRDEHGELPFQWEKLDPQTHLYPTEVRLKSKLLDQCNYLSEEGHAMVEAALALTLLAHRRQYRDTGAPYAVHPLKVALMGIKKYKIDAIPISERLLHDVPEDTPVTLKMIQGNIHPVVADRVKVLSKRRGRHQRKALKELLVEENRQQIFKSASDTPDETSAKLHDRLQNMRTLEVKEERKKREIIFETQEIYVPLARIMGLHDEANELEHLCLVHTSPEHAQWARGAQRFIRSFFRQHKPSQAIADMRDVLKKKGFNVALHRRLPSPADIYRRMGELRPIESQDMYLYVDVAQRDFGNDSYNLFDWGEQAVAIANAFTWNEVFDRKTDIKASEFKQEVIAGLTDALSIEVIRLRDRLRMKLTLYPADVHIRERLPLAYLLSSTIAAKPVLRALLEQKQRLLAKRLTQTMQGEIMSSLLVKQLETRLPEGFIRVVGVNDKGVEEPWSLRGGSTVMDYIVSIAPLSWNKAIEASVNGRKIEVPDYVLQQGDRVHIEFRGHGQYKPLWIHCFRTFKDGPEFVRGKIYARKQKLEVNKDHKALYLQEQQIKEVGKWRLRTLAGLKSLKIGVGQTMDIIKRIAPSITKEDEFFIKVGLGELTDDAIQPIAHKLAELNQNLLVVSVDFDKNESGQLRLVGEITEKLGINVAAVTSDDLGQSNVIILLDSADERMVEKLAREIRRYEGSLSEGLKAIRFSTNRVGAREELLFLRNGKKGLGRLNL